MAPRRSRSRIVGGHGRALAGSGTARPVPDAAREHRAIITPRTRTAVHGAARARAVPASKVRPTILSLRMAMPTHSSSLAYGALARPSGRGGYDIRRLVGLLALVCLLGCGGAATRSATATPDAGPTRTRGASVARVGMLTAQDAALQALTSAPATLPLQPPTPNNLSPPATRPPLSPTSVPCPPNPTLVHEMVNPRPPGQCIT